MPTPKFKIAILVTLLLALGMVPARAQDYLGGLTLSDSARAYLLTCGPGDEFYTTFGHTALRVADPAIHLDKVYNYGTFNFNIPHFYLTFLRGRLDYCLSRTDFEYFLAEYRYEGRWVRAQQLQLTPDETNKLFHALEVNYLEANRYYRYDFFRDNCATRPRDIIMQCLDQPATVSMAADNSMLTYRQLLSRYTGKELMWWQFGVDLLLGQRCDKHLSHYDYMFLPCELMNQMDTLRRNGTRQPVASDNDEHNVCKDNVFVKQEQCELAPIAAARKRGCEETNVLLLKETRTTPKPSIDPSLVFWLLFIAVAAITTMQWTNIIKRPLKWIDITLFSLAAIVSLALLLMWFCTNHYCTKYNWNLLWANPLFIVLLFMLRRPRRWVALPLAVMVTASVAAFWVLPQQYNPAVIPLALTLLIRTLHYITPERQNKDITKQQALP